VAVVEPGDVLEALVLFHGCESMKS